jgi:hypothetical protein
MGLSTVFASRAARWPLIPLMLLVPLAGLSPLAKAAPLEPMSIEEVEAQRQKRVALMTVFRAIKTRGRTFDLDEATQERLKEAGFTDRLITALESIEKVGGSTAPDDATATEPAAPDEKKPAGLKIEAQDEARLATYERVVKTTIQECGLRLATADSDHTRLIGMGPVIGPFLGDVKKLEAILDKKFPEPIASGVDRRGSNIAIFANKSEYAAWTRTLLKVCPEQGIQVDGQNLLETALNAGSFHLGCVYSMCLESMAPEEARRKVAFCVGFQTMMQLTRKKAPDALQTGFGNITEVLMFGSPSVTVWSAYSGGQQGAGPGGGWAQVVRNRFAQRQINSVLQVLGYTVDAMEPPQYAESWSLATLLASAPDRFGKLVLALRGGEEALGSIQKIYEQDEPTLLKTWFQFAARAQ